jgi:hypothetical protein
MILSTIRSLYDLSSTNLHPVSSDTYGGFDQLTSRPARQAARTAVLNSMLVHRGHSRVPYFHPLHTYRQQLGLDQVGMFPLQSALRIPDVPWQLTLYRYKPPFHLLHLDLPASESTRRECDIAGSTSSAKRGFGAHAKAYLPSPVLAKYLGDTLSTDPTA